MTNISSRCVVQFYEMPRYLTSQFDPIIGAGAGQLGIPAPPVPMTLVSQTISLNQIPDKLIIFVRPRVNNYGSDFFLPIRKININWKIIQAFVVHSIKLICGDVP